MHWTVGGATANALQAVAAREADPAAHPAGPLEVCASALQARDVRHHP